ncbi:ABC transporter substrate-binding protein [Pseudomonas sp. PDM04]|jgi:peptide/nickel transport system substrate-binding protein|uniref:ABC transporter substrate-binding protein n=1 Tax=Pseudomonas sp. PDM04 TaxID=2769296 RepID=UPI0017871710|nr:ABC transporter substrate-binding protein [Pseudomonas sp. PDM04]MBD9438374.1 ABC transporter substrate-binding protein [Pseudomonas sp. PDM04]
MVTRRTFLGYSLASTAAVGLLGHRPGLANTRGGTLIIAQNPEPTVLTTGLTTAPATQLISPKIFDGLLYLSPQNGPQPQLAESWSFSPDGLQVTFKLRPGVLWHDGRPFTSADVAFSVMEVWKKYSSRGRSAFPNVQSVETPDPLTAVWNLSRPTPYLLSALNARDSQVLPKHLYAGTDILNNPANTAPIGTGPFRVKEWVRGNYLTLERNPDYWQSGKPLLDQVIYRFIADPSSVSAALETGAVHVAYADTLSNSEIKRLKHHPALTVHDRLNTYGGTGIMAFEFNLQRPEFQDVRVRQAFAHAIDKQFILDNILLGQGTTADSPIPKNFPQFYSADVPQYPFDLKRAEALLEEAGLKRDKDGVRLRIRNDPSPSAAYQQTANFLRSSFAKIGVKLDIRNQDYAQFIDRIYGRYDFDTNLSPASTAPDPAIGLQRFYWSKNIHSGVAYSNATHYSNAQVDALLEQAQVDNDPQRRWDLYHQVQKKVLEDVPRIPIVSSEDALLARSTVQNLTDSTGGGFIGNLSNVTLG